MSLVTSDLLNHLQKELGFVLIGHQSIGHGAHNDNYLLDTSQGKKVLRIYANTQFKNATKEYKVLQLLDGFLGPRAHYIDTSRALIEYDYMILEYIEGTIIKDFTSESLVEIATKLRKLHTVKLDTSDPATGLVSEWTRNNINENSKHLGEEIHNEVTILWERLMNLYHEIEPLLTNYKPEVLIHDDPILGNFVQTEEEIMLIDWELAHPNYFFMELGGFIEENGLTNHQEKIFLDAYGFGSTPDEAKILTFSKAYRITAMVGWFIERIAKLRGGGKVFIAADQGKYEKNLAREILHLKRLLG